MSAHAPSAVSAQARAPRNRRNGENRGPAQLKTLRAGFGAVEALGDDRGYAHWAGIHGLPLPMYCQHGSRLFLPWHRAYLYFFELAMRDRVPDAALAWWDWTSPHSHAVGVPDVYRAVKVEGQPNPLYKA